MTALHGCRFLQGCLGVEKKYNHCAGKTGPGPGPVSGLGGGLAGFVFGFPTIQSINCFVRQILLCPSCFSMLMMREGVRRIHDLLEYHRISRFGRLKSFQNEIVTARPTPGTPAYPTCPLKIKSAEQQIIRMAQWLLLRRAPISEFPTQLGFRPEEYRAPRSADIWSRAR